MKVVAQRVKAQKVTRCSRREKRPSPVKGRWKKARAARQEREAITKFHGARRDCRQSAFLATLHEQRPTFRTRQAFRRKKGQQIQERTSQPLHYNVMFPKWHKFHSTHARSRADGLPALPALARRRDGAAGDRRDGAAPLGDSADYGGGAILAADCLAAGLRRADQSICPRRHGAAGTDARPACSRCPVGASRRRRRCRQAVRVRCRGAIGAALAASARASDAGCVGGGGMLRRPAVRPVPRKPAVDGGRDGGGQGHCQRQHAHRQACHLPRLRVLSAPERVGRPTTTGLREHGRRGRSAAERAVPSARANVPDARGHVPVLPDEGPRMPALLGLPDAALSTARVWRQTVPMPCCGTLMASDCNGVR